MKYIDSLRLQQERTSMQNCLHKHQLNSSQKNRINSKQKQKTTNPTLEKYSANSTSISQQNLIHLIRGK